jgi:hypothetical protein
MTDSQIWAQPMGEAQPSKALWRWVIAGLVAVVLLLLASCANRAQEGGSAFGPQLAGAGWITPGATHENLAYIITTSTNCVLTGQPLTITLTVTNTGEIGYTAALTTSIFDIRVEGAIPTDQTINRYRWFWSEHSPAEDQIRSLTLQPGQSVQRTVVWIADPAAHIKGATYLNVSITGVYNALDQRGILATVANSGDLTVAIDRHSVYGSCPQ